MSMEETAVLLSIQPEWCSRIFSGWKTVEIRKTRPVSLKVVGEELFILPKEDPRMDMGRNSEHYSDPTPGTAWENMRREEKRLDAARLVVVSALVPILRQTAELAGFEIIGRIPLRDKATGKEYR